MHKSLKNFHELHHTHKITHKVLSLIIFTIIVLLAVYGLSRVRADQAHFAPVPNANIGVCYKVGENFNDSSTHVSCKNYKKVCQTDMGVIVECDTGIMVE